MHDNCRCRIERMDALQAGTATSKKQNGADWWLKHYGTLPPYYINTTEAKALGWKRKKGNLASVAPGRWLERGVYRNANGHLPDAPGRIWYEADINYTTGFRGDERILYSNDGLIFITRDHYFTFIEVV